MMRWLKEKLGPQNRQTLFRLLVGIFFALIVTASTLNFDFFRIEAYFYDLRMRLKGGESLDSRIQLLVLESDEQNTLESHLILLKKLKESRAASLAFLNKFDSSDIEANPKLAEEFVSHVREAEKNGTKVILGSDLDLGGEILFLTNKSLTVFLSSDNFNALELDPV
jgi:outer membrane translocation and assembly module TamA